VLFLNNILVVDSILAKCYNYCILKPGDHVKTAARPIKPLNPRSPDTNIMGGEPTWRTQPDTDRTSRMTQAFSWYNYFYGKKDARDMIVAYLELHDRRDQVRALRGVPDSAIRLTTAWLCRMSMVGLELTNTEQIRLDNYIEEILSSSEKETVTDTVDVAPARPNIQDRLREKVSECAGEIDGLFDDFVVNGARMTADYKPIAVIRGKNVVPQMVNDLAEIWRARLAHYETVIEGRDAQLVEAYSNFTKIQLRNVIKFCEAVINDCGAYVQIKKVERKPRKVKAIPPEKRAARFKTQAEFAELKLRGLPAASLVDKTEAWLYDTHKRKLIHVVADSHVGSFTIKGNSIIGFSTVETQQKTVRKPADTLRAMSAAGKPAARKIFRELTTTETAFNGRGTDNLIILRVW
jgi:hypothetical protein